MIPEWFAAAWCLDRGVSGGVENEWRKKKLMDRLRILWLDQKDWSLLKQVLVEDRLACKCRLAWSAIAKAVY